MTLRIVQFHPLYPFKGRGWQALACRVRGPVFRLTVPTKAITLQLEQQQKLCIARLLPLKPEIILMDEPCSALDVGGTRAIEELMFALKGRYTIVIVTHNMAQARRASDECIFMLMGKLVEHSRTEELFIAPRNQKTAEYIEGRYG